MRRSFIWRWAMKLLRVTRIPIPTMALQWLHFRGPFEAEVEGVRLHLKNYNLPVETRLFWGRDWEDGSIAVFARIANLFDIVLDVGANTGVYTVLAAGAAPNAKLVSLEPSTPNFKVLEENVQRNGIKVQLIKAAASEKAGVMNFWNDSENISYSATLNPKFQANTAAAKPHPVDVVRLDEVIDVGAERKRILVKVDVEGHETEVLAGATGLLEACDVVLLVEVNRDYTAAALQTMLPSTGYRYYSVDDKARRLEARDDLAVVDGRMNYLIVPHTLEATLSSRLEPFVRAPKP